MGGDLPSQRRRGRALRAPGTARVCLLIAFCLVAGLATGTPAHAGEPSHSGEVRVLLYDDTSPIQVGPVGATQDVRLGARGLIVGGRAVGPRWNPLGSGPWRVGSRVVRGQIALRAERGRLQVLNRVDLEQYVASTVGGEMSASWPREALRAQAVAARTYVLHEAAKRREDAWDVRATAVSQVYRGLVTETDETRSAARATRGEVLTYQGEPILAVFHSTAGGRTATAGEVWGRDLPYLRVVDIDEEDDAPHTYWRSEFSAADLAGIFSAAGLSLGAVEAITVTHRTRSGRVDRLEVQGAKGVTELRGASLRGLVQGLGLRSTLYDVRPAADGYAFVGSGYGHGVGMSQWGARALAERGTPYQRILARFYPGTRLEAVKTRGPRAPAAVAAGGARSNSGSAATTRLASDTTVPLTGPAQEK